MTPKYIKDEAMQQAIIDAAKQLTWTKPESIHPLKESVKAAIDGGLTTLCLGDLDRNEYHTEAIIEIICTMTQLTELYLFDNELTTISPSIGKLANLEWLDLGNNRLRSLPSELGNLKKLRILTLDDNRFAEVPECLKQLESLKEVGVRHNALSELPSWLPTLKLDYFFCKGNGFETIPLHIASAMSGTSFLDGDEEDEATDVDDDDMWGLKTPIAA